MTADQAFLAGEPAMRSKFSTDAVWGLMCEGCNAAEIAEWFGVDSFVAIAWMSRASREFARAAA